MNLNLKAFLLKLASRLRPKINIKIEPNIENNYYFGENVVFKDGKTTIDNREIKISKVEDNELKAVDIEGTEIESYAESKAENIKKLDTQGLIFTRADIADSQLELLNIVKEHEAVIKKLKSILSTPTHIADLGALLASSTIIKLEDKGQDREQEIELHHNLAIGYKHRGLMIYNLLRSKILQIEVLSFLNSLKKKYKNNVEDIRTIFLPYWDSILEEGYPTAYFVTKDDDQESISVEIIKRFNKGTQYVYIYSRSAARNKTTESSCRKFAKNYKCQCKRVKVYKLGFTIAIKFKITAKDWKPDGK